MLVNAGWQFTWTKKNLASPEFGCVCEGGPEITV